MTFTPMEKMSRHKILNKELLLIFRFSRQYKLHDTVWIYGFIPFAIKSEGLYSLLRATRQILGNVYHT